MKAIKYIDYSQVYFVDKWGIFLKRIYIYIDWHCRMCPDAVSVGDFLFIWLIWDSSSNISLRVIRKSECTSLVRDLQVRDWLVKLNKHTNHWHYKILNHVLYKDHWKKEKVGKSFLICILSFWCNQIDILIGKKNDRKLKEGFFKKKNSFFLCKILVGVQNICNNSSGAPPISGCKRVAIIYIFCHMLFIFICSISLYLTKWYNKYKISQWFCRH